MLSVKSKTASGFVLNLDEIPSETKNYKVSVVAKLEDGTTLPAVDKTVKVEYIPIDTIAVTGNTVLSATGYYDYSLSFTPTNANVGVKSVAVEKTVLCDELSISNITTSGFRLTLSSMPATAIDCPIKVTATLNDDTTVATTYTVSAKVVPTVAISGADSFYAKNGVGSSVYTFGYTPSNYNVSVVLKSITTNSSYFTISKATTAGFTLAVSGTTEDASATITAVLTVDGSDVTVTKTVKATYKAVYNEFKVYYNSAWVTPSTGQVIKVGDLSATYIGEGTWRVDESLATEDMEVTVDGTSVGNYGLNEYSDGSDITDKDITSEFVSGSETVKGHLYSGYFYYSNGDYIYAISIKPTSGVTQYTGFEYYDVDINTVYSTRTYGWRDIDTNVNWIAVSNDPSNLVIQIRKKIYSELSSDITLPSTSFTAKNGTISETITPNSPTGATLVITSVVSSNSAIVASTNGTTISLSGYIAEDSSETGTLTINYTIAGEAYSKTFDVTATYAVELEAVDLGLPSGLLWCNMNVGANNVIDSGEYFQWGSTDGHTPDEGYVFNSDNYQESDISSDLTLNEDAARQNMGGTWRMPTETEIKELCDNTTTEYVSINGVNLAKITSKTNSNYIYIPFAGYISGTLLDYVNSFAYTWASTIWNSAQAYCLHGNYGYYIMRNHTGRTWGIPIRAVQDPT